MKDKGTIVQQLESERDYLLEKIRLLCSDNASLKAQLQGLKEAGEPFVDAYKKHLSTLKGEYSDAYHSAETQSRFMKLHQLGLGKAEFSRLAAELGKVENETSELEIHDSRQQGVAMDLDRSEELCRKMTDTQAPAMRELLERWVRYYTSKTTVAARLKLFQDTKTLLGE